jgi:hypothetical protein
MSPGPSRWANPHTPARCVRETASWTSARPPGWRTLKCGPCLPISGVTPGEAVQFKVLRSWPYSAEEFSVLMPAAASAAGSPGVVALKEARMFVGCADGVLEVLRVQPAGKAAMDADAFLRGYAARLGDHLETSGEVVEP